MTDVKYREYEIQLEKGTVLFLYTDGVVEATNADDEMFGTDRLLRTLNDSGNETPQSVLETVSRSVDAFVKEAPSLTI